ncbi:carboxylate-amine ligase [Nocardioides sp. SYSU DS0663]|uniref:carboxylate-amine ligase n=1 Tax=Nocardioides sp. SYSU DS0663 TaxID=3416445 RepID=UPI003F4B51B7
MDTMTRTSGTGGATRTARTVGVEEELLLVDPESGRPLSVAGKVLRRTDAPAQRRRVGVPEAGDDSPGGDVGAEMQQQQVETDTPPRRDLEELQDDVEQWRALTVRSAREVGARALAAGTSPLPVRPQPQHDERYQEMTDRYGLTAAEHLLSGCHVHVSVADDEEGVGVLDRVRPWLHALLALSANSPFWQGQDSGYASFRSQAIVRWPSAGPYPAFGSAAAYRRTVEAMVGTEVLLDPDMVYFDARLSQSYPTVEVRVADVCLDARDTVLVAGLGRALVETAAREWAEGRPASEVSTTLLRLASWRAGHDGAGGALLDPGSWEPRPARAVLEALVDHVRPALEDAGDLTRVERGVDRVLTTGNGAGRQRAALERTGRLTDVVAELARVTAGYTD